MPSSPHAGTWAERILRLITEGKHDEAVALMNTETWAVEVEEEQEGACKRKGLCPLHSARIKDYLLTFEKESACPCGYNELWAAHV